MLFYLTLMLLVRLLQRGGSAVAWEDGAVGPWCVRVHIMSLVHGPTPTTWQHCQFGKQHKCQDTRQHNLHQLQLIEAASRTRLVAWPRDNLASISTR